MESCRVPRWQLLKQSIENLSYQQFNKQYESDENAVLLDVRTPEEYHHSSLAGSRNLNYLSTTLADELEQLDKQKTYYVFCQTGRRSLRVCVLLKNSGFTICNLDGGLTSQQQPDEAQIRLSISSNSELAEKT